jgi:hypothetical protein
METTKSESAIFSAMQTEKPYKSYRKTILGQVYVKILNPFNDIDPMGVILVGTDNTEDTAIVHVWSAKENQFILYMNKDHFEKGNLIEYNAPEKRVISEDEKYNTLNDEEILKYLSSKYFSLQAAVNKMTSEAPLYRLLTFAEEQEKSEKIINLIKGRLSEVQALPEPAQQV